MYEIPQELKYKEKIIFGLTFSQIAWALPFLVLILIILARSKFDLTLKLTLVLILGVLAALFMFFDLYHKLKNFYLWIKFRNATTMSLKMKKFLGIKDIKDNYIESKNNIAILEITPINFSIKTDKEKMYITRGFQKFLNALDFPVQILMTTSPLNIDNYLNKLKSDKFNNDFNDYKEFLTKTIKDNKVMNRNFYVILRETSNLKIQLDICKEKLESIGIKSRQLETEELKDLFIDLFSKDIINKADKEVMKEDYLHYLISPKSIENYPDSIKINNQFNRIISVYGYPRMVESGFLDKIITTKGDFNLSLHIEPIPIEMTMIMLDKELQKQRADLYSLKIRNQINPSLEIKHNDTKRILEELQKGTQKLYNVSMYINCKAETKEELNLLTKKIESDLNSLMIIPRIPNFQMLQGLKSTSPLAIDGLKQSRNVTTEALSAFFHSRVLS